MRHQQYQTAEPNPKFERARVSYNPGDRLWTLEENYSYIDQINNRAVIIHKGSKFDLSSVPRPFWEKISPFDLSNEAPLIHDFLYITRGGKREDPDRRMFGKVVCSKAGDTYYSRREADLLFRRMMREAWVTPPWRILLGFWAVSLVGWIFWPPPGPFGSLISKIKQLSKGRTLPEGTIPLFITSLILVIFLGIITSPPQWLFTRALSPVICPGAVYAMNTPENMVALTIDDGPDPRMGDANSTTKILDVFQHHNQQNPDSPAHATFFLIGNRVTEREALNDNRPDPVTTRIIAEGHEIGNHMAEDSASILLGERFPQEFIATHEHLSTYAKQPGSQYDTVSWFRPGVGICDRAMSDTVAEQNEYRSSQGFTNIAVGSVWPYDTILANPGFSKDFIQKNIRPGSIIVLHDGRGSGEDEGESRGDRTAQVLESLLHDLKDKYHVVPLSKLLEQGEPVTLSQSLPGPLEAIRVWLLKGYLSRGFFRIPTRAVTWLAIGVILVTHGVALWLLGTRTKFIPKQLELATPPQALGRKSQSRRCFFIQQAVRIFFIPSAVEEIIMRGVLLPSPMEHSGLALSSSQWLQCGVALAIYVLYHIPFGALIDWLRRQSEQQTGYFRTFFRYDFLALTALLGSGCTFSYLVSGSIWPAIVFHWAVVVIWILGLGGFARLNSQ